MKFYLNRFFIKLIMGHNIGNKLRSIIPEKLKLLMYNIGFYLYATESFPNMEPTLKYINKWDY